VQASVRSGSTSLLQLAVASLEPPAKPLAGSRVTKVKRFLRSASTVAAQGGNQGFSTLQWRCRQHNSTTFTAAFQLATRSEPFALVNELYLANSPPAAAVSHRMGCTKRNPIFAPATVRPNPSLNLTRYGKRRKPGPQHASYPCSPGLRRSPPWAG
jgi:hypothetical protein